MPIHKNRIEPAADTLNTVVKENVRIDFLKVQRSDIGISLLPVSSQRNVGQVVYFFFRSRNVNGSKPVHVFAQLKEW